MVADADADCGGWGGGEVEAYGAGEICLGKGRLVGDGERKGGVG